MRQNHKYTVTNQQLQSLTIFYHLLCKVCISSLQLCKVVFHTFSSLFHNPVFTKQKRVILSFKPRCTDLDMFKVQFIYQSIVVVF